MNRAALMAGVLLVALGGCDPTEPAVEEQSIRPAKLFRVSANPVTTVHTFVGKLDAAQTVDVSFEVPGELIELPVREGQPVSKGALVAALDPTNFRLAVQEAEVQLRFATQDLERKRKLLAERGISQSVVDDARAQYDLARVRLAQARKQLSDSRITAPFDALVARRYLDNRAKVAIGEKIARLLDVHELKVVASIPEELLATVTPEHVVSISASFDFLPDQQFPLTYRESTGEANPVAQTYEVTFTMARPEVGNLLPGMTAQIRVELTGNGTSPAVVVPTTALLSEPDGRFFVWVFDPETGRVVRRPVTVGDPRERGIAVTEGLGDGELVVAAGASQLQEGMTVRRIGDPGTIP